MERDLGEEMAKAFGARLRRIYEQDDQGIPSQITASLERLKRAEEQERPAAPELSPPRQSPSCQSADDGTTSFFVATAPSATR